MPKSYKQIIYFFKLLFILIWKSNLQRERSSIHWFTLQMIVVSEAEPIHSQEIGASSRSSTCGQVPKALGCSWLLSQATIGTWMRTGVVRTWTRAHMECWYLQSDDFSCWIMTPGLDALFWWRTLRAHVATILNLHSPFLGLPGRWAASPTNLGSLTHRQHSQPASHLYSPDLGPPGLWSAGMGFLQVSWFPSQSLMGVCLFSSVLTMGFFFPPLSFSQRRNDRCALLYPEQQRNCQPLGLLMDSQDSLWK